MKVHKHPQSSHKKLLKHSKNRLTFHNRIIIIIMTTFRSPARSLGLALFWTAVSLSIGMTAADKTRVGRKLCLTSNSNRRQLDAANGKKKAKKTTKSSGKKSDKPTLQKINISIQPTMVGLPMWVAQQLGWFEEVGIDATLLSYTSGAPQVADAVENQAWDIGVAGSVPNVIAGANDIRTIGLANDESRSTAVFGAPGNLLWPPLILENEMFAVTPSSTGQLVMLECLESVGVTPVASNFFQGQPSEVIEHLESNPTSYGTLWAPNTYVYQDQNPTAEELCTGASVGKTVLDGLMIRDAWAQDNEDLALLTVATYLRAVTFLQNFDQREPALDLSEEFYEFYGLDSVTRANAEQDLLTRPLFNLDEQLYNLNRQLGPSLVDKSYESLAQFLVDQGVIPVAPPVEEYITDDFMRAISDNDYLRSLSYLGSVEQIVCTN